MHARTVWIALIALLSWAGLAPAGDLPSVAFYYGAKPPVRVLAQFDRIVVEPENLHPPELKALRKHGAEVYAYVSVGEVEPTRPWAKKLPPEWVIGRNEVWDAQVTDLAHPGWQKFLLDYFDKLWAQGYRGFFLDTLDSYVEVIGTQPARDRQAAALTSLLKALKQRHPEAKLIANRGFEVMDGIAPLLKAVAAESLYMGWDNAKKSYTAVPAANRQWLKDKLAAIKQQHRLDVIVIDYLPPARRDEARQVAAAIRADGFIPWVANPELDYVGVGAIEAMPREVLMLYDSKETPDIADARLHTFAATPIEYLGYVPTYHDIRAGLPQGTLKGRYAGVVSWFEGETDSRDLGAWLTRQIDDGVPVVILGQPGIELDAGLLKRMGLRAVKGVDADSAKVTHRDRMIGYEKDLPPRFDALPGLAASGKTSIKVHLSLTDGRQNRVDTVLSAPWGGLALDPTLIDEDFNHDAFWLVDPIAFLKEALHLPDMPVPEVTTENGRRLWMAHIDGDALPSLAEMPGKLLAAEVLRDEIIRPRGLPHTVSVVEGEIHGLPQYKPLESRMIKVAQEIFALPNVEIATHTFSHPFNWRKLASFAPSGQYNLPVPDYAYDVRREIVGSAEYIDKHLAPPGKRTKVVLWSGEALATEEGLRIASDAGLLNLNGGNTIATRALPSLTNVSPMARPVGEQLQVYAPVMNENVYTNNWTGPFYGFRQVVETFELTDKPYRLKPINIYYHFYSGSKQAALNALREVYDWTLRQEILPLYASEFIPKVQAFRDVGVARRADGGWRITGMGTLRLPAGLGWPDLAASPAVAGARELHDGVYVHTQGGERIDLMLKPRTPDGPYLQQANAPLLGWQRQPKGAKFRLSGHLPVMLEIGGAKGCEVRWQGGALKGKPTATGLRFDFPRSDTGNAVLDCPA